MNSHMDESILSFYSLGWNHNLRILAMANSETSGHFACKLQAVIQLINYLLTTENPPSFWAPPEFFPTNEGKVYCT